MGFLDKAKAAAEQAAAKAKEGVEDLQAKKDLFNAYNELGKTTFDLAERGELSHPQLDEKIAEIRRLKAELEDGGGDGAAPATEATPAASDQPPAMPV